MKCNGSMRWWDKIYSDTTGKIIFLLSILFLIAVAAKGWTSMLSPAYGFRQAQTAISVRYLLKGGSWFAYETPVQGPPWSIPFEFPLYQWIVALVVKAGLFPLEQAGRFVSEIFFFSSLYPLFKILGVLNLSKRQRYLILALYCMSPLYIFWSRAFMIESAALALSIYYLWVVILYLEHLTMGRARWHLLAGIVITGSLAGMVKVTTFFPFLVCSSIVFTVYMFNRYRGEKYRKYLLLLIFCAIAVPFFAVYSWTAYADSLKALNPLAKDLTSHSLRVHNFGTFAQRLDPNIWKTFYFRTVRELTGNTIFATICIAAIVFCGKRRARLALIAIGLFLLTQLTFTNLHNAHSYYPYANGVFLLVAIGIIITELLESQNNVKRISGLILYCLILFFCTRLDFGVYRQLQDPYFDFSEIHRAVDTYTHDNDVFIIFGADWSSEIPYHIGRKAAMIRSSDLDSPSLQELKERLKNYRVGGFLFYTRNGFDEAYIEKALHVFEYKPARYYHYPWFIRNSEIRIYFDGNK